MTEALDILKMIEEVDPSDTAKLDEIDARVYEYLGFYWHGGGDSKNWQEMAGHWYFGLPMNDKGVCLCRSDREFAEEPPQHTRSRDALKAIRPGLQYYMHKDQGATLWQCTFAKWDVSGKNEHLEIKSPWLKTEELAELHAITQAIEHERSKNN